MPATEPYTAGGPVLPKDPQPAIDRIDELARRILTGDILLPKFQREYVWDRSQILMLLDSITKGYPIGSILLWQTRQELRSERRIADLDVELPRPDYPVNYLLDGQQRLSTICGAMFWKGKDPKSRWNIAYDLRAEKFIFLDTLDGPPPHQLRVNSLADPSEYFKHVFALDTLTSDDKLTLKLRAEALFRRWKDYKVAAVTLGDMSLQDVAPIFERINSQGTQLTIVDLTRAATWSPNFDLVDAIDRIRDDIVDSGFDSVDEAERQIVDRKVILRNISAAAGGGFSVESIEGLREHSPQRLQEITTATRQAYHRTIDFLLKELRVPNARVLPYANQLTILGETFRLLPSPDSNQRNALVRWFWRSAFSGYFSGWNTGMMARDQKAIHDFAAREATALSFSYVPLADAVWVQRLFRTNNALSKVFALMLSRQDPVDMLTGQRIDLEKALTWANEAEFHHVFPRAYLQNQSVSRDKINCLANIVLLTSASNKRISQLSPSAYLPKVQQAAGDNLASWLASNLISLEAFDAALNNDYDAFLKARSHTLQDAMNELTYSPDHDGSGG